MECIVEQGFERESPTSAVSICPPYLRRAESGLDQHVTTGASSS